MTWMPCGTWRKNMNRSGIFIILLLQSLLMQPVHAQQCFNDAKAAYNYLIGEEQRDKKYSKAAAVFMININTATESELTTLKGIGSSKAKDIILYREGLGYFRGVDELTKVKGIGKKTVENNRSRLTVQ